MPNFVFILTEAPSLLADRLVDEALLPMFRKLHPEKAGWNLSLINLAATNMAETAWESKDSEGRDIGKMFRRQDDVLKDFRVTADSDSAEEPQSPEHVTLAAASSDTQTAESSIDLSVSDGWDSADSDSQPVERCGLCQKTIPSFALAAHLRYHEASN